MSLFATKPINQIIAEAEEQGEHTLKKTLSATALTMLGIGAIIGTGIFVLTGQAAGKHAGPAVVLSMILAGVVSALAALCYSEFASTVPISGSAYAYGYATLGEFIAWIIGWDLILEYAFGAATVAVGWSGYVVSFLHDVGIPFPAQLSAPPGVIVTLADGTKVAGVFNLPAFLIAIAVTALLVKGIQESASFNNVIVVIKVAVVVLFIVAGIGYINSDNFYPFIPENTGRFGEYGYTGILTGAAVIFFAYIGFDAVSTAAQEAKNPQRDMPIGIIGSLGVCTVLYILVSIVMIGLVPYMNLKEAAAPIAVAINAAYEIAKDSAFGPIFASFPMIIKVGAILGLSSTMVVMVMGQPRVFYSMSKDGLLPKWAAKVHPRFRTPYITTMITGGIVAVMAGFVKISLLGELVSIGTLFAFVIVSLGVIIMRATNPNLNRPFKVPLSPAIPIAAALASAYLMNGLPLDTWIRLIVWMSIGLVIYFAYSYKHSNLAFIGSDSKFSQMTEDAAGAAETFKAPLSPIIGVLLVIVLTIWMFAFNPDESGTARLVETAIRLFVWITVGAMVYFLTYGKKELADKGRNMQIATYGLVASLINLVVWAGVTYWFFVHYAELHAK